MPKDILVNNKTFERFPIQTHVISPEDKVEQIIEKYVFEQTQKNDILVISERVVAIMQRRLIHESKIKASWLAKILIKFVKKWPQDPGFRNAKKMQVAINEAGLLRILFAAFVSAITKPFGIRGLFYILAGNAVSQIDGFAPGTVPPYDKYAVLGPKDPDKLCNSLAEKFSNKNLQFAIADANNIDVAILGTSDNLKISKQELKMAFIDNPIGQGLELTPVCIVREKK
jgi:F420-0:gamma-glutamyl ligase-like protein